MKPTNTLLGSEALGGRVDEPEPSRVEVVGLLRRKAGGKERPSASMALTMASRRIDTSPASEEIPTDGARLCRLKGNAANVGRASTSAYPRTRAQVTIEQILHIFRPRDTERPCHGHLP